MLESSGINKELFHGPINRLTVLTFRYKPREKAIDLINIREARSKPLK